MKEAGLTKFGSERRSLQGRMPVLGEQDTGKLERSQ